MKADDVNDLLKEALIDIRAKEQAKFDKYFESNDPVGTAFKAAGFSGDDEERVHAQRFLAREGNKGSIMAKKALVELFAGHEIVEKNALLRYTATIWLKEFAAQSDRVAAFILGRIYLEINEAKQWPTGRKLLLAAAFDPEWVDTKWMRTRNVRESAILQVACHYLKSADGHQPNSEKALWVLDLAISLGYQSALPIKARELLCMETLPADERKDRAIDCLETYLFTFDEKQRGRDWPEGYSIHELKAVEELLEELTKGESEEDVAF